VGFSPEEAAKVAEQVATDVNALAINKDALGSITDIIEIERYSANAYYNLPVGRKE
jgi:hypothetical protein